MRNIELLAPARDIECGIAAVNSGADAIYIGAPKYGMRIQMKNSIADIERLIKYAHKYWAKVYVTVNTVLFTNDKIEEAAQLIENLYEIGTDGIIIRDLGLLEFDLPPIPLIASTQMHINTWEKVKFLEEIGISKVVLPRELSLEEIREIREKTNDIELEFFVYGSTCAGYSGLCSLDYSRTVKSIVNSETKEKIKKRCANIGSCDLPCRMIRYSLKDSSGKFIAENQKLLRHYDLNLTNHIESLIDAGITSFKIEGRSRDAVYIKNIVSHYRKEFDKVLNGEGLKKTSSGQTIIDFIPNPSKTTYREYMAIFTDLYMNGRKKEKSSPQLVGTKLGKIKQIENNLLKINSETKINKGDKIFFREDTDKFNVTTVTDVKAEGWIIVDNPGNPVLNQEVFRCFDKGFIDFLKNTKPQRKISIDLELNIQADKLILSVADEDNNKVTTESDMANVLASDDIIGLKNVPPSFNESIFKVRTLRTRLREDFTINKSLWNEMVLNSIQKLEKLREENHPKLLKIIISNNFPYPEEKISYWESVYNDYTKTFYYKHGVKEIEPGIESEIILTDFNEDIEETKKAAHKADLNLKNKKIMTLKYCLKNEFDLCKKQKSDAVNAIEEPLYLIDEDKNITYQLNFDCQKCEMSVIYI